MLFQINDFAQTIGVETKNNAAPHMEGAALPYC